MYCHQPSSVFLTLSTWIMDVACIAQSTTWSKLLEFGTNSLHRIFASYDSHLWSLTLHCLLWKKVLIVIMSWTMWTTCHHHCIIIWRCSTDLPSCSRLNYRWHTLVICPSSLGFQFSAHRLVFPQWNYAIELLQRASMSECHSTATYVDTSAKCLLQMNHLATIRLISESCLCFAIPPIDMPLPCICRPTGVFTHAWSSWP
jgi:hypothetical protein